MTIKFTGTIFTIAVGIALSACGQTKKTTGNAKASSYLTLVEANSQKILPGAPGMEPYNDYRFIVIWKNNEKPESFFWKGKEEWLPCSVGKVRRTGSANSKSANNRWYKTTALDLDKINKGDTLELLPVTGGKYPIPTSIPQSTTNSIFFKTSKTAWLSIPVTKINKKPDIVMP